MKTVAFAAALCALSALPAAAVPLTFQGTVGTFEADDDVALFEFAVEDIASFLSVRTVSYAGGTLQDGTEIPAGGFDPVLTLFDGAGEIVTSNNDDPDAPVDPDTGLAFDAGFRTNVSLPVGEYTLALTQYDNFAIGPTLASGFDEVGDPNLTAIFGCDAGQFCDFAGFDRTSTFALDASLAPIPLPAGAWLLGGALVGMGGLGLARRRR